MDALMLGVQGCTGAVDDDGFYSKHVMIGAVRIASRLVAKDDVQGRTNVAGAGRAGAIDYDDDEDKATYFYHSDHLGSTGYVSDHNGKLAEHIAYFPFGETWIEQQRDDVDDLSPEKWRFTGKELDSETGLYYFGARYYDPRTSVWQSADPILGKYLPSGNKEQDQNLPGMGGVFNSMNLGLYTYTHQNPVVLVDPDGKTTTVITIIDPGESDHTAVHVDNPLGESGLFDPAGAGYQAKNEYGESTRGLSQSSFIGKSADLNAYIKENQKKYPKAEIILQEFDTTKVQERDIAKRIDKEGHDHSIGFCTSACKNVIEGIGSFKKGGLFEPGIKSWTLTPSGLMKDLEGLKPNKTIKLAPLEEPDL